MMLCHGYDEGGLEPEEFIRRVAADVTVDIRTRCKAWDMLAELGHFSLSSYIGDMADVIALADRLALAFGRSRRAADAFLHALEREHGSAVMLAAIRLCRDLHGRRVLH
jgi:hypothetical protein